MNLQKEDESRWNNDKFKARFVIQGFRQKEGINYFGTYAPVTRITTIRLLLALAGFVMSGNEHKVCKLVKSLYGLKQAPKQWHHKFDEVVLSSGFHLNQSDKGGAILWAFKKQTCITGSTIESEFVALVTTGKEAEWLRNLIHEILIWTKPIAPISILCDSAPKMAKAYSRVYNGKSRHLGVRHGMIMALVMKG
nr:zinc finger, CCHC-type [Tanacetum cinerariifolium]